MSSSLGCCGISLGAADVVVRVIGFMVTDVGGLVDLELTLLCELVEMDVDGESGGCC